MTKFPLSAAVAQKSKTHYDGSAKVWYAKFIFSTHSSLPFLFGGWRATAVMSDPLIHFPVFIRAPAATSQITAEMVTYTCCEPMTNAYIWIVQ